MFCRCSGASWTWCGWWSFLSYTRSGARERKSMAAEVVDQTRENVADTIEMPAPTVWPIALAFGITLLFAGLVTSASVSVLGAIAAVVAAVGWFRDVFPHEAHEVVAVVAEVPDVTTTRREVLRIAIGHELRRGGPSPSSFSTFPWGARRSCWGGGRGAPGWVGTATPRHISH